MIDRRQLLSDARLAAASAHRERAMQLTGAASDLHSRLSGDPAADRVITRAIIDILSAARVEVCAYLDTLDIDIDDAGGDRQ